MSPRGRHKAGLAKNLINRSPIRAIHAVVTQLGECKTEDLEVAGSSPAHGTMTFFHNSAGDLRWNLIVFSST